MVKRLTTLTITLALAVGFASTAFGAQAIFGAVGQVTSTDNSHLNGTVGCRMFSVSGSDAGINNNQNPVNPPCWNNRCVRNYNTTNTLLGNGYICQGENTVSYNNDLDGQTFYNLIDGEADGLACNHIAFYAVQGGVMSATELTPGVTSGNHVSANCSSPSSINCFTRADTSNSDQTPLTHTNATYGSIPHQIASIGGLSPVPVVRIDFRGPGCPTGQARLTWDNPETYAGTMKNSVPSPVRGVRLYQNVSPCSHCPTGQTGWAPVSTTECPGGNCGMIGGSGTCVPIPIDTDSWLALTVRLKGPGSDANSEIETGMVNGAGFVGANSQCFSTPRATASRIVNISARYAGRGSVSVNWTTGAEGGVQSYFVTRSASPSGPFTRISEAVAPQGDGNSYSFQDKVHTALGRTQYYAIEIVDADGSSEHSGPTAVVLPAAKKRLGAQ